MVAPSLTGINSAKEERVTYHCALRYASLFHALRPSLADEPHTFCTYIHLYNPRHRLKRKVFPRVGLLLR